MIDINMVNRFISINWRSKLTIYLLSTVLVACSTPGPVDESLLEDGATPPSFEEIIADGDESLQANNIDAAQISYALAVEREPDNISALYKLAFVHIRKNSLNIAEPLLRHAISVDNAHLPSKQLLGLALTRREKLDEAESVFQQVLAVNPNAPAALNGLGVIHDVRAQHSDAQEFFNKALRSDPRSAKIANNLGYSLYLSDNYDEAEYYFLEALKFDSNYERAWANLALLLSRTGRIREAETAFRKIGLEHQAANNLGYLGILQGDLKFAREQLDRAVSIAPSYYELANRNLDTLKDPAPSILSSKNSATPIISRNSKLNSSTATDVVSSTAARKIQSSQEKNENKAVLFSVPLQEPVAFATTESSRPVPLSKLSTKTIQGYLNFLGYKAGTVDGQMGNTTLGAIREFQRIKGLDTDGVVGSQTEDILIKELSLAVKNNLLSLGYVPGSENFDIDRKSKRAIEEFQRDYGLKVTGNISLTMLSRLSQAVGSVRDEFNSSEFLDLTSRG